MILSVLLFHRLICILYFCQQVLSLALHDTYLVLPGLFSLVFSLSILFCFFQILFVNYSKRKSLMLYQVISSVLCLYLILFTDCCVICLCHQFQSSLKCGYSTYQIIKVFSSSRHGLKVSLLTQGKLPLESAQTLAILVRPEVCSHMYGFFFQNIPCSSPVCKGNTEIRFPSHKLSSSTMKISCMVGTIGCGQTDMKSKYFHCQPPILKRSQWQKWKTNYKAAILQNILVITEKHFCNHPKALLAVYQGDQ